MVDGRRYFYDSNLRTGALLNGDELSGVDKLVIVLDGLGIEVPGDPG